MTLDGEWIKDVLYYARNEKMSVRIYMDITDKIQHFHFKGEDIGDVLNNDNDNNCLTVYMQNKGRLMLDADRVVAVEIQPGFGKGNF